MPVQNSIEKLYRSHFQLWFPHIAHPPILPPHITVLETHTQMMISKNDMHSATFFWKTSRLHRYLSLMFTNAIT
jgi:hypothetical protein